MIYPDETQTAEAVAEHYNSLDPYYLQLWGEHLHHGYWKTGMETVDQATEQLVDIVAHAGKIDEKSKVLDVGCGYGATSRHLAKKWEARLTSLTASKAQWQYARTHDPESTNPRYILGDFLDNDFVPDSYDVIISIESSEHMEDKEKFFSEVMRLLKPGGRFVTCAWLAKEAPKNWEIKHLLEPICREGRLPSMGSQIDYQQMMENADLKDIQFEDISHAVKKTWTICARRFLKGILTDKQLRRFLLNKNRSDRVFAKTVFRIWSAYQTKSMRYGLFTAKKEK